MAAPRRGRGWGSKPMTGQRRAVEEMLAEVGLSLNWVEKSAPGS
jgi:hypothetical protein